MSGGDSKSAVLIKWLNTFQIDKKVASLADLVDGVILYKLLNFMDASYFEMSKINTDTGSVVVNIANINVLKEKLEKFLNDNEHTEHRLSQISSAAVGQGRDLDGVKTLLEYCVIASALYSTNKNTAIKKILAMEENEQSALMSVLQAYEGEKKGQLVEGGDDDEDLEGEHEVDERDGGITGRDHAAEQRLENISGTNERVAELTETIHTLEKEKAELLAKLERSAREKKETENENRRLAIEIESILSSKKQEIEAAVAEARLEVNTSKQTSALQSQRAVEKAGRQQEELENEIRDLKAQMESAKRKSTSEIGDLKANMRKLQDDLDLQKSKAKKSVQLEQKMQTYKKKAGEINELKIKLAESIDQNSASMGKILDLEEQVKAAVDQKTKYVALLATSQNQLTDSKIANEEYQTEITRLKEKLDEHRDRLEHLRHTQEVLQSEKEELERDRNSFSKTLTSPSFGTPASRGPSTSTFDGETLGDSLSEDNKHLKQKILQLEAENKRLKDKADKGELNELQEAMRIATEKSKDEKLKEQIILIGKLKDASRDEKKKVDLKEEEIKSLKEKVDLLNQTVETFKQGLIAKESESSDLKKKAQKIEKYAQKKQEEKRGADDRVHDTIQAFSKENEELNRKIKRLEEQRTQHLEEQRLVISAFYDIGMEYQSYLLNRNLDGAPTSSSRRAPSTRSWLNKERNKTYA